MWWLRLIKAPTHGFSNKSLDFMLLKEPVHIEQQSTNEFEEMLSKKQ